MKLNKQKRKLLLVLPAVVIPFLCMAFYLLGGGRGGGRSVAAAGMGLNTQLPKPKNDPRQAFLDKMQAYAAADRDSMRRKEYERQDPYRKPDSGVVSKYVGSSAAGRGVQRSLVGGRRSRPGIKRRMRC